MAAVIRAALDAHQLTLSTGRADPIVIEARQLTNKNAGEIACWCSGIVRGGPKGGSHGGSVLIQTLEGRMEASPGDWVIEGVQGEFYPCARIDELEAGEDA